MFTSQSLRAVVPPGALVVREQRLDDVVHQLDVRGTLDAATLGELSRRIDAVLAGNTDGRMDGAPTLVHEMSKDRTLGPGDLSSTGTPPGVAAGRSPPNC